MWDYLNPQIKTNLGIMDLVSKKKGRERENSIGKKTQMDIEYGYI